RVLILPQTLAKRPQHALESADAEQQFERAGKLFGIAAELAGGGSHAPHLIATSFGLSDIRLRRSRGHPLIRLDLVDKCSQAISMQRDRGKRLMNVPLILHTRLLLRRE